MNREIDGPKTDESNVSKGDFGRAVPWKLFAMINAGGLLLIAGVLGYFLRPSNNPVAITAPNIVPASPPEIAKIQAPQQTDARLNADASPLHDATTAIADSPEVLADPESDPQPGSSFATAGERQEKDTSLPSKSPNEIVPKSSLSVADVVDKIGKGIVLIKTFNSQGAELGLGSGFIVQDDVTWRNFVDGPQGNIAEAWQVESFPTLYVVDHKGVIRYQGIRDADLERAIVKLVAEAEGKPVPSVNTSQEQFREYTDIKGRKAKLKLVRREGDAVVFEREDGKSATMSLSLLSEADQIYLQSKDLETKSP